MNYGQMSSSQAAAMREDAEEQAAFNRKVGYRGPKKVSEYTEAMQAQSDLIDEARD